MFGIAAGAAAAAKGGIFSGIAGGLGKVAGGIGSLFGIGRGKRQNKRNRKNMLYQHELDKGMFDYQNAYNTPAAQMQRLKDAGLNPALMYSQGNTGNASGYPQTKQMAPYQETPVDTMALINSALAAANIRQVDAQTEGQEINNDLEAQSLPFKIKRQRRELKQMTKQIENTIKDTEKKEAEKSLAQKKREIAEFERQLKKQDAEWIIKGNSSTYENTIWRSIKAAGHDMKTFIKFWTAYGKDIQPGIGFTKNMAEAFAKFQQENKQ